MAASLSVASQVMIQAIPSPIQFPQMITEEALLFCMEAERFYSLDEIQSLTGWERGHARTSLMKLRRKGLLQRKVLPGKSNQSLYRRCE